MNEQIKEYLQKLAKNQNNNQIKEANQKQPNEPKKNYNPIN